MGTTKAQMKAEAVNRMYVLDVSEETIDAFRKTGEVCLSLNGKLYPASGEQKDRIQKFEKKTGGLVYHLIWSSAEAGNLLTLLYVSKDSEEWVRDRQDLWDGVPVAYVVNWNNDMFSEFGTVGIETVNGAVIRTA